MWFSCQNRNRMKIWHSLTECLTIFQFGPLKRNARQCITFVHCGGMLANFLILPSVTGTPPIFKFRALQRKAHNFFKLAHCNEMLADFSQNTPRKPKKNHQVLWENFQNTWRILPEWFKNIAGILLQYFQNATITLPTYSINDKRSLEKTKNERWKNQ